MPQSNDEGGRARNTGPLGAAKAVFWAFFGVRRKGDHERDLASLTPVQVILTGIIAAALFVAGLVPLVTWITA